jgi:hypothetical protein
VATGSTLDAGGTRFEAVARADSSWQRSFDFAVAEGGHLATFENNVGIATAVAEATFALGAGYGANIGLEQSTNGAEPGGGWHWSTGNTTFTWGTGEPLNDFGAGDVANLNASIGGTHINDITAANLGAGYLIEYENAKFIRTGDATLIDTMTGSANADVMAGLGGADVLSGRAGDDRFMVPDTAFASINGGTGFDVVEYTAAATISGTTLASKVTDVDAIHLGAGNQALTLNAANVQAMSSTTDTLYISSSGSGDTLDLTEVIGTGANQWHNLGAANGVATYQYFDATNSATLTKLLIDSTIVVS